MPPSNIKTRSFPFRKATGNSWLRPKPAMPDCPDKMKTFIFFPVTSCEGTLSSAPTDSKPMPQATSAKAKGFCSRRRSRRHFTSPLLIPLWMRARSRTNFPSDLIWPKLGPREFPCHLLSRLHERSDSNPRKLKRRTMTETNCHQRTGHGKQLRAHLL